MGIEEKKSDEKAEKTLALLQSFQDFTDALTLHRIAMVLLAGILSLVLFTTFENRTDVFNLAFGRASSNPLDEDWTVTEESAKELTNVVRGSDLIKLVLVTQVDLRKNRRTPKFWYLNDPEVSVIKQRVANMLPMAVFDTDQKNTQQLVAVLNNEFVCSKTEDTVFGKMFPEVLRRMPYICRMAVPPFYGRFVGLLTFGLSAEPTKTQYDALKIEASRISIQIYLRDVMHHKR